MLTYVAAGTAGLPLFAEGRGGISVLLGPTGGYLVGFIFAAALVGFLAERGWDRTPWMTALAMLLGNIVIYLFGLPWLAVALHLSADLTVKYGLQSFLLGDAIKLIAAVVLLPAAHLALRLMRPVGAKKMS
jgi:biotin transport system substrate-specific component